MYIEFCEFLKGLKKCLRLVLFKREPENALVHKFRNEEMF